ncbi:hypothetical protein ACE102_07355 [Bradyrhizobium sp. vgs-9]|uniref:hypothetical protein n=1 Tax=Bradyrhizobium sp. vgs-9 TaxID=208389 RepID=UPI0035D52B00
MPPLRDLPYRRATILSRSSAKGRVAEVGGTLRVLDLTEPSVREAIQKATSAKAAYEGDMATEY